LKIYFADDSAFIRHRLTLLIGELEAVTLYGKGENGLQAIDDIDRLKPDVVILDIQMPEKNGIEVLKAIRALDDYHPVIIIITAFAFDIYRKVCAEYGADHFFDKADEFEKIKDVIEALQESGHRKDQ